MSKLQRTIDGQNLAFVTLPRIFQSLTTDTPSGSVRLTKGDHAYWRLTRNLGDLKKKNISVRDAATHLAKALKSLTESEAFLNHYGLVRAPEMSNEANLTKLFINLLQMNANRIEQSSVFYDRSKPLVESIVVPLGHQVQFTATRGMTRPPHGGGLKGRLWLKEADHTADTNYFTFNISSPVVNLGERLHPERLQKEIIGRLRQNLPTQVDNPVVEFDEGQFNDFLGNGLKALVEKTAHAVNGASKKKAALVKPAPATDVKDQTSVKQLMEDVIAHQPQLAERLASEVTASRSGSATIYPEKIIADDQPATVDLAQVSQEHGQQLLEEADQEFKGRGHSMPNVSIDDQQFSPAADNPVHLSAGVHALAARVTEEVKGRGQSTSIFPIDEPAYIDVQVSDEVGNTVEKDSDGHLLAAINDVPAETAAQVAEAISDAAAIELPESYQAAYNSAAAVQDTGLLEALELVPVGAVDPDGGDTVVDPVLTEQQQMKADRDVGLILDKVRTEIGTSTRTQSVVVPIVLSPTQKTAVRDAFVREGVGEVWFYDVIGASTAIVLQWVTNEGEPSVDINGQLVMNPMNVESRPDEAGDTSFRLPV